MLRDHRASSGHFSTSIVAAMRVAVEQHINFAISESPIYFHSSAGNVFIIILAYVTFCFSGKLCILIHARWCWAVSALGFVFLVKNKRVSWNTGWARLDSGGEVWNKQNPNFPSQRTRRSRENSRIFSLPQERDWGGRGVGGEITISIYIFLFCFKRV